MAKQPAVNAIPAPTDSASGAMSLAERLFVASWKVNGNSFTNEHLAMKCLEAAEAFRQVASERELQSN